MFNFSEYSSLDYGYFYIAIAGTLFLVLQYLFTFLDIGDHLDADTNYDGNADGFDWLSFGLPFNLFTLKGIIAFVAVFGWTGLSLSRNDTSFLVSFIFAFCAGFIMMLIVALIYYGAEKLGENGNIEFEKSIGKQCEVYIPIPASNTGTGKVQIVLNDSLREIEAVTEGEHLKSGEIVKVVKIINDKLVVEKIN
ncbi:MAG: hypothetical protein K0Q49_988 [Haloplasmataceae bacterium]|jgi:membrane protein implicated in regulation of membrane protease activity|nr:hypothetical protein [Haloplasmataceae bacterium]